MITPLDDANFATSVLEGQRPVLVMFHAPWAGPARLVRPVFEELAEEVTDVSFAEFDIDASVEIPAFYGVRAVPLFVLFDRNDIKAMKVGVIPKEALKEMLA